MGCRRLIEALACVAIGVAMVLTTAAATPATAPAKLPALDASEAALLHRLESGTWRERKAAGAELAAMGPDQETLLQTMLAASNSPEAHARLAAIGAAWAIQRLIGPTHITIHMKDASAKAVYAELFRQAGAKLTCTPDNLLDTLAPLSLDVDRQPFWTVMQQLGRITNLGFTASRRGMSVGPGQSHPGGAADDVRTILIVASSFQRIPFPQTWPTAAGSSG